MLNSTLPANNKILDIYSNANKFNREKDENHFKLVELDGKKQNVDKQTSEKLDTDGKLIRENVKDEEKSKFVEWYAINSIVNSLPVVARKDAIEFLKNLLKQKHIVLNENFTITNLKIGMNIDVNEFLKGIFMMKATIKNNHKFFNDIMEYISHKIFRNVKLLSYKENGDANVSVGGQKSMKSFK